MFFGCPRCAAAERPANLQVEYDINAIMSAFDREDIAARSPTMWRYAEWLPPSTSGPVSIGEGFTPLIHCRNLGRRLGLTNLYVKDESQNPTWSFKDRMASAGVTSAIEMGFRVVTAASSGNGGAAAAAYAARGGIDAVIFTTPSFPAPMRALMQVFGASLIATERAPDRWKLLRLGVEQYGWFPTQNFNDPPIGANPFALEGCKTLGFEIAEQMAWSLPEWIVAPVGSGDSLVGIWKGLREWLAAGVLVADARMPRLVGAEVFGSLSDAIDRNLDHTVRKEPRPTVAVSTATANSAYQCLHAIRDSDGVAQTASDDEIMELQLMLAQDEGIYTEASSALSLAAIRRLHHDGVIAAEDRVVAILTSGGLKDPEVTLPYLEPIPLIDPTEDALVATLRDRYAVEIAGAE